MSTKTHYEILQVHPEASPEVIKAAYKSLSTKFHPDRDKSADAAGRFAEIQNAYNILSEPDRRRQYDADLARGLDSTGATSGSSVVFRVDGTSTFLTLDEHHRRRWQEAAGCELSNMNLRGVSFVGANLEGAKLDGSNFSDCDLRGAVLTNASAKDCNFEAADFPDAVLRQTDFENSDLSKARFCTYTSGRFISAVVDQVSFAGCNLSGAAFVPELPKGWADVGRCRVNDCDFSNSDLSHCDLRGMDFRTCQFAETNLFRASLQGCNFEGVDLSSANLINANLSQVVFSDSSKFPDGYVLPADAKNADIVRRAAKVADEERGRGIKQFVIILSCMFAFVIILILASNLLASRKTGQLNRGNPDMESFSASAEEPLGSIAQQALFPDRPPIGTKETSPLISAGRDHDERSIRQSSYRQYSEGRPATTAMDYQAAGARENLSTTYTSASSPRLTQANEFYDKHQYAEAITLFEQLIADDKRNPIPKNNLARLLATCPDERYRDGRRALVLAMEAHQQSAKSDWKLMCVIAAAYAEQGDFSSATYWAYKARRAPDAETESVDTMLAQFHRKQPCRW